MHYLSMKKVRVTLIVPVWQVTQKMSTNMGMKCKVNCDKVSRSSLFLCSSTSQCKIINGTMWTLNGCPKLQKSKLHTEPRAKKLS